MAREIEAIQDAMPINKLPTQTFCKIPINHRCQTPKLPTLYIPVIQIERGKGHYPLDLTQTALEYRFLFYFGESEYVSCRIIGTSRPGKEIAYDDIPAGEAMVSTITGIKMMHDHL